MKEEPKYITFSESSVGMTAYHLKALEIGFYNKYFPFISKEDKK